MGRAEVELGLDPDEKVVASPAANRSLGPRAAGGRLYLTAERVLFIPHKLDALIGDTGWSCKTTDIVQVNILRRSFSAPFGGSLRRRLQIHLASNVTEIFVVNHAASLVTTIKALAPNAE
jgi:hypothetical protein